MKKIISFDGMGFNDPQEKYWARIATLTAYGKELNKNEDIGKKFEVAVNSYDKLVTALHWLNKEVDEGLVVPDALMSFVREALKLAEGKEKTI